MPEICEFLPKEFLERQGQDLPAVLEKLREVRDDLSKCLGSFNHGSLQHSLYEPVAVGAWSPAQIFDHLSHSTTFFAKCLERDVQGKPPIVMPRGHLTVDGRAISPAGEPRAGCGLEDLRRDHLAAFAALEAAALGSQSAGVLGTVCVIQSFFGPMTGLEVLRLVAWHGRHHLTQISNAQISADHLD
jgi:hypothetical protein